MYKSSRYIPQGIKSVHGSDVNIECEYSDDLMVYGTLQAI